MRDLEVCLKLGPFGRLANVCGGVYVWVFAVWCGVNRVGLGRVRWVRRGGGMRGGEGAGGRGVGGRGRLQVWWKRGEREFCAGRMTVSSTFRTPHAGSEEAEWVCKGKAGARLRSRSQAKGNTADHSKECGISTLYEREKH